MVKKKHPEQEDTKEPHTGENTENKEHIKAEENTANSNTGASEQAPEAEVKSGDKAFAEATPDKASQGTSELEVKLAEAQDKYLRLSAEFDNYRKRTLREKMDLSKYAAEDLLLRLLPVMDDFERALSHMDTSTDGPALKQGIDLIYNKFSEFFKQTGVKEVEAVNCQFNVDVHDAVAKIAVEEEDKKGKIVDVIQKGYFLQDKVIRHAKVVVGE